MFFPRTATWLVGHSLPIFSPPFIPHITEDELHPKQVVLWRTRDQGPRFRPHGAETLRLYRDKLGRPVSVRLAQEALETLRQRTPALVWKLVRGDMRWRMLRCTAGRAEGGRSERQREQRERQRSPQPKPHRLAQARPSTWRLAHVPAH